MSLNAFLGFLSRSCHSLSCITVNLMNHSIRVSLYCHFLQEAFPDLPLRNHHTWWLQTDIAPLLVAGVPIHWKGTTGVFSICRAPASSPGLALSIWQSLLPLPQHLLSDLLSPPPDQPH